MNFLPTTPEELEKLGWKELDVIIVTGDAYVDHPSFGAALIGRLLQREGYRVGIIAQPDWRSGKDILRLGEPRLFWGVTGGSLDSMVANYTATKRPRQWDDYTPGGRPGARPDRAVIVYVNLIKKYSKSKVPIIIGGIEASLRRFAHYDYWDNRIRRSVLLDSKADLLVFGMAERTVVEIAEKLARHGKIEVLKGLRGVCYVASKPPEGAIVLPSYEEILESREAFERFYSLFYSNNDPVKGRVLAQLHGNRYVVCNPPQLPLTTEEMDWIYSLPFSRRVHPYYAKQGEVRALQTVKFSITALRGCYGDCSFCALAVHQGRTVSWRSHESILEEARRIASMPDFKGYITDIGGPTANMYGIECEIKRRKGVCPQRSCLFPKPCPYLPLDHSSQIELLEKLRSLEGIKGVFISSGIRHDMVMADRKAGRDYLAALVKYHISGQINLAPEHSKEEVLKLMRKPSIDVYLEFLDLYRQLNRRYGKRQFYRNYFIAAHPGCTLQHMLRLRSFIEKYLKYTPLQVQIFTPTPSTYSTLMFWTERDPWTGRSIPVEKRMSGKKAQKRVITGEKKGKSSFDINL